MKHYDSFQLHSERVPEHFSIVHHLIIEHEKEEEGEPLTSNNIENIHDIYLLVGMLLQSSELFALVLDQSSPCFYVRCPILVQFVQYSEKLIHSTIKI